MPSVAIVARNRQDGLEYLKNAGDKFAWAISEAEAEIFADLHAATRAALTLPGRIRAFALPLARGHEVPSRKAQNLRVDLQAPLN